MSTHALSIGAVLIASYVFHGQNIPGITPDSVAHISVAHNLPHKGLYDFTGESLTLFPPLYAIFLAVAGTLFELHVAALVVNTFFLSGIAVVVVLICNLVAFSQRQRIVTLCLTICLGPLLTISSFVWVETSFTFFLLLFFYIEHKAVLSKRLNSWQHNLSLALILLLAFEVRYAALFLIPYTIISRILILDLKSFRNVSQILFRVGVLMVIPIIHMSINYSITGGPFGVRHSSADQIPDVVTNLVFAIGNLINPYQSADIILYSTGAIVLTVVCIVLVKSGKAQTWSGTLSQLSLILSIYFGYISSAQLASAFDAIDARILSPIYPLLIIMLVAASGEYARHLPLSSITIIYVCYALFGLNVYMNHRDEVGFSSENWSDREWNSLNLIPSKSCVISDSPEAVYLYANMQPVTNAPQKSFYRSDDKSDSLEHQLQGVCRVFYYVWLGGEMGDFYPPEEFAAANVILELLYSSDQIQIYISKGNPHYLSE